MGLDAYVPCSCYARGLVKPCPVEVSLEDGRPWPIREDDFAAYDAWRESACAHPEMEIVAERVGNWASIRLLQDALDSMTDEVACLRNELPDANGGSVEAARARMCLDQLANGLYVTDPKTGQHRFRDGDRAVHCAWSHQVETSYEVIQHVETATDHEGATAALERLFRAAVEHDTCVVWC